MFCAKCGNELQDGQTFCPNCGSRVTAEPVGTAGTPGTEGQQEATQKVDMSQLIDQKRFIRCSQCGQVYAKKGFSFLNIALIVLGIGCCFFFFPLGVLMILLGVRRKHPPCPSCGNTEKELEEKRLRQKQFSYLTAERNNKFYRFLYTWNKKLSLASICNIVLVVLGWCLVFPYFQKVTLTFYWFDEVIKEKTTTYGDALLNANAGFAIVCILLAIGIALLVSISRMFSLRVRNVTSFVIAGVGLVHLILIFIASQNFILQGWMDNVFSEITRELIDNGSVDFGGCRFWLIFIQILVVGLSFLAHEFEKATWLNNLEGEIKE